MPRVVRCGLIQAQNVKGPEAGLEAIKKAMVDKHVKLIEKAAKEKVAHPLPAGALLRPVLLRRAGDEVVPPHRAHPGGADHAAHDEAGQEAPDGHRGAGLRGGPARRLLQHRFRHRRRRQVPGQVPQDAHPALQAGLLGEVLLPPRQPRVSRLRDRLRQGGRLHLLRPPLPGGRARARAWAAPRSCSTRRPPWPASASTSGSSSSPRTRWPTATSSAPSTASAPRRPGSIGEFYGQSYFCDPRGKIVEEGPRDKDAVVVADLNLDMIEEVRSVWQFYRDRRPERTTPGAPETRRPHLHSRPSAIHSRERLRRRQCGRGRGNDVRDPVPPRLAAPAAPEG